MKKRGIIVLLVLVFVLLSSSILAYNDFPDIPGNYTIRTEEEQTGVSGILKNLSAPILAAAVAPGLGWGLINLARGVPELFKSPEEKAIEAYEKAYERYLALWEKKVEFEKKHPGVKLAPPLAPTGGMALHSPTVYNNSNAAYTYSGNISASPAVYKVDAQKTIGTSSGIGVIQSPNGIPQNTQKIKIYFQDPRTGKLIPAWIIPEN